MNVAMQNCDIAIQNNDLTIQGLTDIMPNLLVEYRKDKTKASKSARHKTISQVADSKRVKLNRTILLFTGAE